MPADVTANPLGIPSLQHIQVTYDQPAATVIADLLPRGRPCVSRAVLEDIDHLSAALRVAGRQMIEAGEEPPRWIVHGSRVPGVFNLGGDLAYFVQCVRARDVQSLRSYALRCVRVLHEGLFSPAAPVLSVALVEGDALAGGFEAVLACDFVLAERQARFGLPESRYSVFPGMGAYSLLSRRVGHRIARDLIVEGRMLTAEEAQAMGLVDAVVNRGEARGVRREFIAKFDRDFDVHVGVRRMRQRADPVLLEELRDITDTWTASLMQMDETALRKMERVAGLQKRRWPETGGRG